MSSILLPSRLINGDLPLWPLPNRVNRQVLSRVLRDSALDRVNVLGNNRDIGHTGCVNALHWARDGELLLSAGDDTTVQIWRMDSGEVTEDYPFVCQSVIDTGHRANIFNAHMLPYSTRIATVAGDRQVRVFDVGHDLHPEYSSEGAGVYTSRCHTNRVKRIVTENSPETFITVGEDGTVRQHDLRTPHNCRTSGSSSCPAPLLRVEHKLSAIAASPLSPYHLVVAGYSPYGYLFDRRHTGRMLEEEWGMRPNGATTCVRRFGRPKVHRKRNDGFGEHVTGARMATENGYELILSYSGDGVYLYSTLDDPEPPQSQRAVVPPNTNRKRSPSRDESKTGHSLENRKSETLRTDFAKALASRQNLVVNGSKVGATEREGPGDEEAVNEDEEDEQHDDEEEIEDGDDDDDEQDEDYHPWVPLVMPRKRYTGVRNTETVKDVNFLGPYNEFITSGSDDGNFFIWDKATGKLQGIYEGDSSVVNVIEGHPHLPLIAVSGIDYTVKLFGPERKQPNLFSRTQDSESIIEANTRYRSVQRIDLLGLLMTLQRSRNSRNNPGGEENDNENEECVNQ